jgi:hypothetical protein
MKDIEVRYIRLSDAALLKLLRGSDIRLAPLGGIEILLQRSAGDNIEFGVRKRPFGKEDEEQ